MTPQEQLFLNTLADLEARSADLQADEYLVLGVSALLRKLFFDDLPLVDQVNRAHRLKLTFNVQPSSLPPASANSFWMANIDPHPPRPWKTPVVMKRDDFYATTVCHIDGRAASVRDTVLFVANVMGGVHAGVSKTEKEKALESLNAFGVGGRQGVLTMLQVIGRVAARSLIPLRQAIEKAPPATLG